MVDGESALNKTISRFQRLQLTLIVAALVAPLLSFIAAPAHAVAATCAEGGVCQVGDTGPGGGIVFYVAPDNGTFTQIGASGSMCTTNCKYLEAARVSIWGDNSSDPLISWTIVGNQTSAVTGADGTAIGSGYQNSVDILNQSGAVVSSSTAATVARAFGGGSKSDWYLPSKDELNQLNLRNTTVGGFVGGAGYWSSSESTASGAWGQSFPEGTQLNFSKSFTQYVRPIRAFAPATQIAITRAAVGTQRGTAFTTQPQITIQYTNNDTVTVSSAVVTATISSGGTLVGTTTATASSGVATFSNLGVDGTIGTTYTISYTALDLPIASATVTLTGTTCDGATFTCQVGDTGPGGGKIFYVAPTTFTQLSAFGSMCKTWCKYLEAAPSSWFEGGEPSRSWATNVNSNQTTIVPAPGAQQTAIGTGYQNSNAIVAQTGNVYATSAAVVTRTYRGQGLTDWYLPSKDELNALYAQKTSVGGLVDGTYWSSSENSANNVWDQMFLNSTQFNHFKSDTAYLRPIRAFGTAPTTISNANVVIPAPVLGATPVNSITSNGQYTTAITWSGSPTTFAASTAYTATVTVTPVDGYTLGGVVNGFFTVNGNAANSVINTTNIATSGGSPYAATSDREGNIYLANKFANNVTKITPQGVTSILGTTGTSPSAISVDSYGTVYTANQGSNNVTKITAQGVSSILGTTGSNPAALLVDFDGNVYTANEFSNNVTKITAQGVSSILGTTGTRPYAIAIDVSSNIYTANYASDNVTKITQLGASTIFGSTGLEPVAITIDSAGNIYTANYASDNVTKITPQGVSSILGTTSGGPNAIAIDAAGNIYTANYSSNNVTKITPQGVSSTYGTTSNYPTGITVDSEGNIYTANYGSSNVTRFSGTNSGVFTYQFPSTAAASAPVVYVAPTPVPYLKTLTTPKLNLKDGKLMCTPGTYNSGYTLDGVVQGSTTALYSPSSLTYNLFIDGIKQTALAVTSSTSSQSWNMPTGTAGALLTCSVTVTANGLTNTDKSNDNPSAVSSALSTQAASIKTANADYSASLSANSKSYQKALVDNRTKWRSDTEKIRTDYYAERDRIKSLPSTKTTRSLSSAALKAYSAAIKKAAADYKASQPAALAVRDAANKTALAARDEAISKANTTYGTFIESIGYGVLIP